MQVRQRDAQRIYVQAHDPKTKRRINFTVYDCTPEQFAERVGVKTPPKARKREAVSA